MGRNIVEGKSSWVETANADNSGATATRAAPSDGLSHYVTSVSGSFDTSSGVTMILKEGSTEIARWYVQDWLVFPFSYPIKIAPGSAVSLELAASGTGGVVGAVNMTGYTL